MEPDLNVLYVTSEWPTEDNPHWVPFLTQEVEYLQKKNIVVDVYHFRGKKHPFRYLYSWMDFHIRYDFQRYDLIHAIFGQSGLVALPAPIPLVITLHGSDLQGWIGNNGEFTLAGKLLQRLSRFVARHAQEVIVVSPHLAKFLPRGVKYHVIPGGINLELFKPIPMAEARIRLNLPPNRRLVLFPADPKNPIKRYPLAEAACSYLESEVELEIIPLINIPHHKVPEYMNACDLMLLTSRHEGSPTVVKEALACNTPIVSVDVGDVKKWISQVEGCMLCMDDEVETISAAIKQVLDRQQRVNGRKVVAPLSLENTIERIISVYTAAVK